MMWSNLKSFVLRTILTLACLGALSADRPAPTSLAPTILAAPAAGIANNIAVSRSIEMTVVTVPAAESRLPRGHLDTAKTLAGVMRSERQAFKTTAEPAEIVLFQAILAGAESSTKRPGGPSRSPGGPGGGSSGRAPDPDLPPEFDPNFENWQKDADIKLRSEDSQQKGKEHTLALANPDSFLVICVAGCRPSSDEIVYRVSKTSAAAVVIAARRMETTAAQAADGSSVKTAASSQDIVACIAGCYRNDDISPAEKMKRSAAAETRNPIRTAEIAPVVGKRNVSISSMAHRISVETRVYLSKKRMKSAAQGFGKWRTKITFNGAKSARYAEKREKTKRTASSKISRHRGDKKNSVVTEASGFIF